MMGVKSAVLTHRILSFEGQKRCSVPFSSVQFLECLCNNHLYRCQICHHHYRDHHCYLHHPSCVYHHHLYLHHSHYNSNYNSNSRCSILIAQKKNISAHSNIDELKRTNRVTVTIRQ